jgi:hypothetical protein
MTMNAEEFLAFTSTTRSRRTRKNANIILMAPAKNTARFAGGPSEKNHSSVRVREKVRSLKKTLKDEFSNYENPRQGESN